MNYRVEPTPHLMHFGKRICLTTGKFMGWEPHPGSLERTQRIHATVNLILAKNPEAKEAIFLKGFLGKKTYMTEPQRAWFKAICEKYGTQYPS